MTERESILEQSEVMLRAFMDGSPDSICIRDRERRLLHWNDAFARGVKENCGAELKAGMRAEDYIPAELLAGFNEQREHLALAYDGEPQQAEFAYPCPDGVTRHFDVRWSPVRIGGEVEAVAEITRDITEQKAMHERLRQREVLFDGYMESSNESIHGFELDPPMPMDLSIDEQIDYCYAHARIVVANAAWARQAGYERWEDMIGIRLDDIVPRAEPENVAMLRELAAANFNLEGFVSRDLQKDGSIRIVLNNHMGEVIDGCLVRTWGAHRDITELEAGRQKLREAEEKYRSVVENANEAIIITQDERATFWNPQALALTGYSEEQFAQIPFREFIHPEDRAEVEAHYRKRLSGEEGSARYTIRLQRRDGETRWVLVNSTRVEWEGRPASLVLLSDVTQRIRAEEAERAQRDVLARLDRTSHMEQLAGSLGHELNQPLTGILSNAQAGELLLRSPRWDQETMTEIMAEIVADTKRAGDVIRNLRDIYRQQVDEFETVEINAVVGDATRILRSEFILQNVVEQSRMAEAPLQVLGNRIQLQQVIINLVLNGLEAMCDVEESSRNLCVLTEIKGNEAIVAVEDSGPGIDPAVLDHVFEPLATWKPGGTGMGLAISHSIIRAHGGRMWAENRSEGGARVGFALPLSREAR